MRTKYSESQLIIGNWYACMHVDINIFNKTPEDDSAGAFFKFLGDDTVEMDSNACGEPNYMADGVPCADYYVDL